MFYDQNTLRFESINGQQAPCEGPRAVPLTLDFSATTEYILDMQNVMARGFLSMIQSLFIDNKDSATPMLISFDRSGQTISVAAGYQAYLGVLCPNPSLISFDSQGGVSQRVELLNYPVTNCVWKAS